MFFFVNRRSNVSHVLIGILGLFFLVQSGLSQPESNADKGYTINLENTDLQELIRFVADATGSTVVVDPSVKGKVNVISSKPITKAELYDLFLSILDVHNYTAIRSGEVVRVIQNKEARTSPVGAPDPRRDTSENEYVTQVVRLENISAAKLIPVLRPLVPQQSHLASYTPSNSIIIADVASNIDRILEIVKRMDNSAIKQTHVVTLKYAVADDVVAMLQELAASQQKQGESSAFESVLVADNRTNSVLVTGDEIEVARVKRLITHLDTPLKQSGNVQVIYLEYAQAAVMSEVLSRVMANISRLQGKNVKEGKTEFTIEADEGTNALIITAEPDQMASLLNVIQRLDIRRAQVLVEAIIVEMDVGENEDLGLQWLFANNKGFYGSNVSSNDSRLGGVASSVRAPGEDTNTSSGLGEELDIAVLGGALVQNPGLSLGWGTVDDELSMTVILNALETQTNANILSTPSLLTLDNQEAYITVGQKVPFVTGSYTNASGGDGARNPFQTVQRENVGITLTVTPQINEGDSVVLDLTQEISNLTGVTAGNTGLITNERKISTRVLADDGAIVVLGGLIKDDIQSGKQKVPVLGSIPLFGRLFRTDSISVSKTNLLIFIRSTVIRDAEQLAGATAEKYRYIKNEQDRRRREGLVLADDEVIPILPEWEEQIKQLEEIQNFEESP